MHSVSGNLFVIHSVIELKLYVKWEPDWVIRVKILIALVRARPGKELPLKNAIIQPCGP